MTNELLIWWNKDQTEWEVELVRNEKDIETIGIFPNEAGAMKKVFDLLNDNDELMFDEVAHDMCKEEAGLL